MSILPNRLDFIVLETEDTCLQVCLPASKKEAFLQACIMESERPSIVMKRLISIYARRVDEDVLYTV